MDRELDRFLAEKVIGWEYQPSSFGGEPMSGYYKNDTSVIMYETQWSPTTDISQAFQVVEQMRENDFWFSMVYKDCAFVGSRDPGYYVVFRCVRGGDHRGEHDGADKNPAMAICLAAREALNEIGKTK